MDLLFYRGETKFIVSIFKLVEYGRYILMKKDGRFEIRINKDKKENWKRAARIQGKDLTKLIEDAVFEYLKK